MTMTDEKKPGLNIKAVDPNKNPGTHDLASGDKEAELPKNADLEAADLSAYGFPYLYVQGNSFKTAGLIGKGALKAPFTMPILGLMTTCYFSSFTKKDAVVAASHFLQQVPLTAKSFHKLLSFIYSDAGFAWFKATIIKVNAPLAKLSKPGWKSLEAQVQKESAGKSDVLPLEAFFLTDDADLSDADLSSDPADPADPADPEQEPTSQQVEEDLEEDLEDDWLSEAGSTDPEMDLPEKPKTLIEKIEAADKTLEPALKVIKSKQLPDLYQGKKATYAFKPQSAIDALIEKQAAQAHSLSKIKTNVSGDD